MGTGWEQAIKTKQKIALKKKLKKFKAAHESDSDDEVEQIEKEEAEAELVRTERAAAASNAGKLQGWSFNQSVVGSKPAGAAAAKAPPPPWAAKPGTAGAGGGAAGVAPVAPAGGAGGVGGVGGAGGGGGPTPKRASIAEMTAHAPQEAADEVERIGVVKETEIIKVIIDEKKDVAKVQKWLVLSKRPDGQPAGEHRGRAGLSLICLQSLAQAKQMSYWRNAASSGYETIQIDDQVMIAHGKEKQAKQWKLQIVEQGEKRMHTFESANNAEMMEVSIASTCQPQNMQT
jgi:hypothetical protein